MPFYQLCVYWLGLFAYGACFGSFMNVVVYRLPRRCSVVLPSSRCPRCRHAIRPIHNLPVLGWLMLRGKCFDCGLPISARYPLMETAVGVLFVVVGSVDVLPHVGSLPAWIFLGHHLMLLCTLLCAALIELDGHEIPRRLVIPAWIVGLTIPLAAPQARLMGPVPALAGLLPWQIATLDALFGLGIGCALGLCAVPGERQTKSSCVFVYGLVGLVLGWQLTACVAMATGIACLAAHRIGSRQPHRFRSHTAVLTAAVALAMVASGLFPKHLRPEHAVLLVWGSAMTVIWWNLVVWQQCRESRVPAANGIGGVWSAE